MAHYFGMDIGGTKIAFSLGRGDGTLIHQRRYPTDQTLQPADYIAKIYADFMTASPITADAIDRIGIACPGPFNPQTGTLGHIPNIETWRGINIRKILHNLIDRPLSIENDANIAALAENSYGSGTAFDTMVYITVSTGIGCGIIVNRHILQGASGNAGELGHIPIVTEVSPDTPVCGCGKPGCLEAFASGTAILNHARSLARREAHTHLLDRINAAPSAKTIINAALNGDRCAQIIWDNAIRQLAQAISTVIQILNPQGIIIGGGVSKVGLPFLSPLIKAVGEMTWPGPMNACTITLSTLGDTIVDKGLMALCHRDHARTSMGPF